MSATYQFIYWSVILIGLLVVLFFGSRLMRNAVARRVRQIREFGMDFDAVAAMLDKGLLTPEEAKRVKSVLTRHFTRLYAPPPSDKPAEAPEAALLDRGMPLGSEASRPAPPPAVGAGVGAGTAAPKPSSPGKPLVPSAAASGAPSPETPHEVEAADLPLDVLDMYQAGLISDEELQALRRFYAAQKRPAR